MIRRLSIPLPPTKAEQEAIAEALSDADALIESLEQLLAKKRQIKQGAMQELLTGKKRLPGFSGEWEVKPLGEMASIPDGLGIATASVTAMLLQRRHYRQKIADVRLSIGHIQVDIVTDLTNCAHGTATIAII